MCVPEAGPPALTELGKEAVHAADGAEVAAPEAALEEPGADHRARGDEQQQAAGEDRALRQVPHLLQVCVEGGGEARQALLSVTGTSPTASRLLPVAPAARRHAGTQSGCSTQSGAARRAGAAHLPHEDERKHAKQEPGAPLVHRLRPAGGGGMGNSHFTAALSSAHARTCGPIQCQCSPNMLRPIARPPRPPPPRAGRGGLTSRGHLRSVAPLATRQRCTISP